MAAIPIVRLNEGAQSALGLSQLVHALNCTECVNLVGEDS